MESLNADFVQFPVKIIKFCLEYIARNSSLIGDISEVFSKFTKFPVVIVSRDEGRAFFAYHLIT